ncbi:hypothetical protein E4631_09155 [Hymenobacter sp. UV11]|uniref:hypothetical protein n=1 Tax=Hymenobacter sp. UV11 TaxID=1849735 RepID=UPI00105EACB0|nr:hypothetical protein [Hymenobacter sp. UV11]TDN39771.1 hypothetical protein A8B98_17525 [Hymenobacter sp. UV11]TFZ67109.1 hypothetical protein E4631_09155 [Hymenobacter sp. UV11]
MNKFLTLVFLGLLLVILRFSTQTTSRESAAQPTVPASYAGLPPSEDGNALSNHQSGRMLVAAQQ